MSVIKAGGALQKSQSSLYERIAFSHVRQFFYRLLLIAQISRFLLCCASCERQYATLFSLHGTANTVHIMGGIFCNFFRFSQTLIPHYDDPCYFFIRKRLIWCKLIEYAETCYIFLLKLHWSAEQKICFVCSMENCEDQLKTV